MSVGGGREGFLNTKFIRGLIILCEMGAGYFCRGYFFEDLQNLLERISCAIGGYDERNNLEDSRESISNSVIRSTVTLANVIDNGVVGGKEVFRREETKISPQCNNNLQSVACEKLSGGKDGRS